MFCSFAFKHANDHEVNILECHKVIPEDWDYLSVVVLEGTPGYAEELHMGIGIHIIASFQSWNPELPNTERDPR